ncbi:hypothetical protein ILUMI_00466 [Ignelater luminosus]|uniref:Endonuclease-reverse transcriptase n=1 Tax=Ignelater luminosus TaxID=2038154 RepID=A0A8K0DK63_IGNLU|nr:hypothetical protein ILUMI_00466 [Ignelater luminosus]
MSKKRSIQRRIEAENTTTQRKVEHYEILLQETRPEYQTREEIPEEIAVTEIKEEDIERALKNTPHKRNKKKDIQYGNRKYNDIRRKNVANMNKHRDKIRTVEVDYMRWCLQYTRRDKIRTENIWREMEVKSSVANKLENRALKWYGHVSRMGEERWPKRILEWSPKGRRRRTGRPAVKWKT